MKIKIINLINLLIIANKTMNFYMIFQIKYKIIIILL